ncbi:MAG: hypothetical protein IJ154_00120 [Bacteroidales bacterium]|nr:hypothetical protein [Bacteroidales bacterium]
MSKIGYTNFAALDSYDSPIDSGTYVTFLFLSPSRSGISIGGTTILPEIEADNRYRHSEFILVDGSLGVLDLYNGYTDVICA